MEIIYLLIPISLFIILIVIAVLFWAIRSGQYDDLEGPRHQILMDDDQVITREKEQQ
ncbi:MAG: cbb3-type cytochrome oxidase assembly protein CcoS [Gammaproteobacteria bacterium]